MLFGVSGSMLTRARKPARWSSGRPASSTRPIEVHQAGSRAPTCKRDADDSAPGHPRDIDDVLAGQHRGRAGLLELRGERPHRRFGVGPERRALQPGSHQGQEPRRQLEAASVERRIAFRLEREQQAPGARPRQPGPSPPPRSSTRRPGAPRALRAPPWLSAPTRHGRGTACHSANHQNAHPFWNEFQKSLLTKSSVQHVRIQNSCSQYERSGTKIAASKRLAWPLSPCQDARESASTGGGKYETTFVLGLAATLAMSVALPAAWAQDTVIIANIAELSGTGATVGHELARRREARRQGDQRRRRHPRPQVEYTAYDTPDQPADLAGDRAEGGRRGRLRVIGPVFSGSTIVNMLVAQQAGIPNFTGGESRGDHRRRATRTSSAPRSRRRRCRRSPTTSRTE